MEWGERKKAMKEYTLIPLPIGKIWLDKNMKVASMGDLGSVE